MPDRAGQPEGKADAECRRLELETGNGPLLVAYRIRRSARAGSIRISISRHNEVTLVLPMRSPEEQGLAFLHSKASWLQKHLANPTALEPLSEYLARHAFLSIAGRRVLLVLKSEGDGPVLRHTRGGDRVVVEGCGVRTPEADTVAVLRGLAARVLPERTHEHAAARGLALNRVTVRDQSSRWGSCSTGGNISLNWRLLLLSPELQDYVIFHELAHVKVMDHSARYWSLLERWVPNAREKDRRLTEFGARIMALANRREK